MAIDSYAERPRRTMNVPMASKAKPAAHKATRAGVTMPGLTTPEGRVGSGDDVESPAMPFVVEMMMLSSPTAQPVESSMKLTDLRDPGTPGFCCFQVTPPFVVFKTTAESSEG
jgi:hypothetical protein